MHISKQMLHEDLRKYYFPTKVMAYFLSKPWMVRLIHQVERSKAGKNIAGLDSEMVYIPSSSGAHQIRVRIFRPKNIEHDLPGFLYLHGGGYMIGNPETSLDNIKRFIDAKPCVIVAPDYRLAIDEPYPASFDDCYDTLIWMKKNAAGLGIIPDKFILGGHSAGGGLTAALSLKARDTGDVQIAFQIPIYPMMDDRQVTQSSKFNDAPVWNTQMNKLGWGEYLRGLYEQKLEIPSYAAPARATDYAGLPPTITIVGDLDPFRDETVTYVENLRRAGCTVKFKFFEGCFHGFDVIAPKSNIAKSAWGFVLDSYSEYLEHYINS